MRLLSLGAGVQSTTLALMSAEGLLPKLDGAIFADTGYEPRKVYDHLNRLEGVLADAGIPVYRVSNGNLRQDTITPSHRFASIPYFIRNLDGSRGQGRRQCTHEYKVRPISKKIRELLGAKAPDFKRVPAGRVAEQWIGFSADEVGRVNDRHDVAYSTKRYPLLELGLDHKACRRWLESRGWTDVPKSACLGCPYSGNAKWRQLRDESPGEWADAVEFDKAIRHGGARGTPLRGTAYLHQSRLPLDEAPIDRVTRGEWKDRQGDLLVLLEDGDPDGCSPYGCRSGAKV